MEQNIKLILYVKIAAFILLTWICHFNNYKLSLNRYFDEYYNNGRKIYIRNSRLLAKPKQELNLNVLSLKKDKPISAKREKGNNKKSNRISLNNARYYTEVVDYNNSMFDGKHFHFEKKWIRKKDYDTFVEKNSRVADIALKKIKFRNYSFGVVIFILFFLLGIGLPILKGLEASKEFGKNLGFMKTFWEYIDTAFKQIGVNQDSYGIFFSIVIIVLGVILIIAIPKILRNNEKYKKIKLMYK
ncbi:fam-m protein [Plasmodium malariae]|uniref:Fam-m protein n=1 Tax=Plasmodium malariae TaxID=5858 RepID=A0A1D3JHV5_PLAMA|nr:fam-m protein [Plasmodium malariae]SBT85808.1 fam-m protein [Plasmodium malariae]